MCAVIPYLITFALAIGSVGLWTIRVATTARGSRVASAAISTVEATTYVVAVSHLMGSLDAPIHLLVYAIGVGTGTYIGLTIDSKLPTARPSHIQEPSDGSCPETHHGNRINVLRRHHDQHNIRTNN